MGVCPICHQTSNDADEAFLDKCFHSFCFQCILQWTETQREAGKSGLRCPVCKASYRSVYHDCVAETYRRCWLVHEQHCCNDESDVDPPASVLSQSHRLRRSIYYTPANPGVEAVEGFLRKPRRISNDEVRRWLEREVQALTLQEDVSLVVDVVMASVLSIEDDLRNAKVKAGQGIAHEDFCKLIVEQVTPFLGTHSEMFACEVGKFLNSGLNVRGYDGFVTGRTN